MPSYRNVFRDTGNIGDVIDVFGGPNGPNVGAGPLVISEVGQINSYYEEPETIERVENEAEILPENEAEILPENELVLAKALPVFNIPKVYWYVAGALVGLLVLKRFKERRLEEVE